jgi:hypothetical protein
LLVCQFISLHTQNGSQVNGSTSHVRTETEEKRDNNEVSIMFQLCKKKTTTGIQEVEDLGLDLWSGGLNDNGSRTTTWTARNTRSW